MQRFISILLLFSFLFSTVGVIAATYHCSMEMPAHLMQKQSCCTDTKGCCEKEVKLLRLNDDFLTPGSHGLAKLPAVFTIVMTAWTLPALTETAPAPFISFRPPPPKPAILPFIQSFLI
jgi:hypothetical protein